MTSKPEPAGGAVHDWANWKKVKLEFSRQSELWDIARIETSAAWCAQSAFRMEIFGK